MHYHTQSSKILIKKEAIIFDVSKKEKLQLIKVNLPGFTKQSQSQSQVLTQSICS